MAEFRAKTHERWTPPMGPSRFRDGLIRFLRIPSANMKGPRPDLAIGEVFVAGGQPTVTYNPRESLQLEQKVRDYLTERRRVLSIAGPTKSGKTVLLKSIVAKEKRVWLEGGQIDSIEAFWEQVGDELKLALEEVSASTRAETNSSGTTFGASIAPGGVGPQGSKSSSSSEGETQTRSYSRTRSSPRAAAQALLDNDMVLVIDDFHYIGLDTQRKIIHGIKGAVFEGLAMIVAAVPHRGEDPIHAEKEMNGRVSQLRIPFWTDDELRAIATEGFDALNVGDPDDVGDVLVKHAFKSPHLMQQFCRELGKANGILRTQTIRKVLSSPPSVDEFFRAHCSITSREVFDLLVKGPPTRGKKRLTKSIKRTGEPQNTDIYGAVLAGIAHTGPLTEISVDQLRDALATVLVGEMPARNELSRVLGEMAKIAKKTAKGDEPVVDYVSSKSTLYISDPFFAYYLRWCMELPHGA